MTKKDIIFSLICGLLVSWLAVDFLGVYGLIFVIVFPLLSVLGFYITELLGKKYPFIHQAGKFGLAGAFADVIDIKVFQILFLFVPFYYLVLKSLSFLAATLVKYWFNKYWAFHASGKENIKGQAPLFFLVTLVGLGLNVASFYYFTKIIGPQFMLSTELWREFSIILSAFVSATVNFLGYKFVVFKK
jgi:putative flippase GtrA